jgi:predicted nucleic acid-binding protein
MRVVVDTNVFVSAILKVNSLPFLIVRWIDQHGALLKSVMTEREILRYRCGDDPQLP